MSKGYKEHTVYSCEYCKLEAVFDSKEAIDRHLGICLMNPDNKFPLTNKNVVLKAYGFSKRNYKEWQYDKTYYEVTPFMRPYNTFLDRELEENELYESDETWEERDDYSQGIPIDKTDDFNEFIELLDEEEDAEVTDEVKEFVGKLNT